MQAVGLNFRDVLNILGMYPGDPGHPGSDCAGIVIASGSDTGFKVGDCVFGQATGSLGTMVDVDSLCMALMPPVVNFAEASTLPTVFLTALACLRDAASVKPRQTVLVHAASGNLF